MTGIDTAAIRAYMASHQYAEPEDVETLADALDESREALAWWIAEANRRGNVVIGLLDDVRRLERELAATQLAKRQNDERFQLDAGEWRERAERRHETNKNLFTLNQGLRTRAENTEAATERVQALAESWIGFDESHTFGDAVLLTLLGEDEAS